AGQGQLQPAAQRGPVDGGDHRLALAQIFESLQRLLRPAGQRRRLDGALRPRQHLHVGADHEVVGLGGGDHNSLDRRILGEPAENLMEVLLEGVAQRIHALAGNVVEDEREAWRLESTCAAKASWISTRSMSLSFIPARLSAFGAENAGACRSCQPGSTAAYAYARRKPSGRSPSSRTRSSAQTTRAAALSVKGDELRAVIEPYLLSNTGLSLP